MKWREDPCKLVREASFIARIYASDAHSIIMQTMEEALSITISTTQLLEQLLDAHEALYDVKRSYEFAGSTFPGYAEFHTHGEKYVLAKKAKLWEVDAHEYLFFFTCDSLTNDIVTELVRFMTTEALTKVEDAADHMSSYLSLVIICEQATADAIALMKRTRFRKNLLFGFHGWVDLRLALIELETMQVYTNGQGKELRPTLEANLHAAAHSKTIEKEESGTR